MVLVVELTATYVISYLATVMEVVASLDWEKSSVAVGSGTETIPAIVIVHFAQKP